MWNSGLVSITFRQLSPEQIIDLVGQARLQGIEWGGDIHVPPNDLQRAKRIGQLTREAGLDIAAYGSYYRFNEDDRMLPKFQEILQTASALETDVIRVWAGAAGSVETDEETYVKVVKDLQKAGEYAVHQQLQLALEYHGGTLTDQTKSAVRLMQDIDHPAVKVYWQPPVDKSISERLDSLQQITPWLSNLHVFQWDKSSRLPLINGIVEWREYLQALYLNKSKLPPMPKRYAMIEFVKGDSPEQFLEDAATLKSLLESIS